MSHLEIVERAAQWAGLLLALGASALYLRVLVAQDGIGIRLLRRRLLWGATALMTLSIAGQTIDLGTIPLLSPLAALYFYSWLVFLVFLLLVRAPNRAPVGTLLVPFGTVCAAISVLGFAPEAQVNPIFRNPLFAVHTLAAFLAYSALSVACSAGVLYLVLHDQIANKKMGALVARLPSLEDLDRLGFRTVALGFSLLTVGILVGVWWARQEWGVTWIWEPKGVWALLTWLLYAGYLLARGKAGWRGVRAAWLTTVGFAASIFTLLGTNYLLGWGRHVF